MVNTINIQLAQKLIGRIQGDLGLPKPTTRKGSSIGEGTWPNRGWETKATAPVRISQQGCSPGQG